MCFIPGESQTQTALGDPAVNRFSDRSSILLASIKKQMLMASVFFMETIKRIELLKQNGIVEKHAELWYNTISENA